MKLLRVKCVYSIKATRHASVMLPYIMAFILAVFLSLFMNSVMRPFIMNVQMLIMNMMAFVRRSAPIDGKMSSEKMVGENI